MSVSDTLHLNIKASTLNTFDVIVIGSGMTGGWAAKEFCEHGLKTLVLERGRDVQHIKDYPTATMQTWQFPHRLKLPLKLRQDNPILSKCYAFDEATQHFFVKDNEHPYIQTKPFSWIRGYQVGGKSLMWARWTQRWSDLDFEANTREGIGIDWPIRYRDIAPWYSYVEKFVGISGNKDGLEQIPDGEFLPPMEMNCLEKHFKQSIEANYPGRNLVISRTANLTTALHGRGPCQYRNLCHRGCPFGGYFSANAGTIPAALATGRMTLRPFSVVHSIIYDDTRKRATGVRVIDSETMQMSEYYARVIFLNAGTLNSTLILLNSISDRFPQGIGNDSGVLGHYLMDHNYRGRISGVYEGFTDKYYFGKRPTGTYLPRFRNIGKDRQKDFVRGYAYSCSGFRRTADVDQEEPLGEAFKQNLLEPGVWQMGMTGMGECLPYYENHVKLSTEGKDAWGMPLLDISCEYKANEAAMLKDLLASGEEMLAKAGFKDIVRKDSEQAPGLGIHEMGTARMGRDPKTSVLNAYNQVHTVRNVFVTDGACMTSSACQNPSLTYMALTARAAHFAIEELKKQNI